MILVEEITKHDELNPDIFDGKHLKPEVREKLLQVAEFFIDNLKDDDVELDPNDIVLIGSSASYNYTKDSDLDVHIIADMSVYEGQEDLAQKLYYAYKSIFNDKYDPMIYGHEAEVYVEPDRVHANSNGIYSLTKDAWEKFPDKDLIPTPDYDAIDAKFKEWEDKFDNVDTNSIDDIQKFIDDLYIMRQESILREGEYGIGNLAFKEMRNHGYLDYLKERKKKLQNKEMSLEDDDDISWEEEE